MARDAETPRSIAILGLVMLLLAVVGFVGLGIVLKMNGYPAAQTVHWTPIAVNLRQYGHWFLAVPLLWAIYAVISHRIDRGILSERVANALGAILLCLIPALFLYAIMNPFTRPLLIYVPNQNSVETRPNAEHAPEYRARQ